VQEINLYHLLKFYAKHWAVIVIATVIGLLGGVIYNKYIQVPMYKSNATLLVINTDAKDLASNTTLINNYSEIIKSRRVLENVIGSNNINLSYEALAGSVSTTTSKDTQVIKLNVTTKSPQDSEKITNGIISVFKQEIKNLYNKENIKIVDTANFSSTPYNVRSGLQLILASMVGFMGSIIGLFFYYDYRLNNPKPKKAAKKKTSKKASPAKKTVKSVAKKATPTKKKTVKTEAPQVVATTRAANNIADKKWVTGRTFVYNKPKKTTSFGSYISKRAKSILPTQEKDKKNTR
jgi:capsular polysaccharide biosynthesis protein